MVQLGLRARFFLSFSGMFDGCSVAVFQWYVLGLCCCCVSVVCLLALLLLCFSGMFDGFIVGVFQWYV